MYLKLIALSTTFTVLFWLSNNFVGFINFFPFDIRRRYPPMCGFDMSSGLLLTAKNRWYHLLSISLIECNLIDPILKETQPYLGDHLSQENIRQRAPSAIFFCVWQYKANQ